MAAGSSVVELCTLADAELDAATSAKFFHDDDDGAEGAISSFSWPEPRRTPSELFDQSAVQELCEMYKVPSEYIRLCLDRRWVVSQTPPEGAIFVYADALEAGMRIPLHDFHVEVLRHYGLAPSQLAPDAWRYLAAFVVLSQDAGVEPSLPAFCALFAICTHDDGGGGSVGWHHFRPRPGSRCLFNGLVPISPDPQWKSRFFLIRSPSTRPWLCPVKWGKPSRAAVRMPVVTADTDMMMTKLLDTAGSLFSRLRVGAAGFAAGPPQPPPPPPSPPSPPPPPPPPPPEEPTRKRKFFSDAHTPGPELVNCLREALELAEKAMAEHDEKGKELEATRVEVARLTEALSAANAHHAAEIRRLEDEHRKAAEHRKTEIAELQDKHAAAMARLEEDNATSIARLEEEHATIVARLKEENAAVVAQLKEENAAVVAQLKEENAAVVAQLKEENAAVVARVKDAADKEVQDTKKKIVLRLFPKMDVSLLERPKLKGDPDTAADPSVAS